MAWIILKDNSKKEFPCNTANIASVTLDGDYLKLSLIRGPDIEISDGRRNVQISEQRYFYLKVEVDGLATPKKMNAALIKERAYIMSLEEYPGGIFNRQEQCVIGERAGITLSTLHKRSSAPKN